MTENLRALHEKVDAFFTRFAERYADHIQCAAGCNGCCQQSLSLFPVELDRLRGAVERLDGPARERLAERARADDGPCPLLEDGRCVTYEARPTICRSHGAAVAYREAEERRRDVCPLNFTGPLELAALPDDDLLDIDRLNALLALTNHLAMQEAERDLEREPLRVALRRWLFSPSR